VRSLFVFLLLFIAAGLAYAIVLGVLGQ
jgi:hypothetical protein